MRRWAALCGAIALLLGLGCASTTVTAVYDAEGRLRRCHVRSDDVARIATATCTEEALTVHHAAESGWADAALGVLSGWLAGGVL